MKTLVTGAGGFIARYLIPQLQLLDHDVFGFDIAPAPEWFVPADGPSRWLRGDLGSVSDVYRAMSTVQPDCIVHLGSILAGPCEDNPVRGFAVNFGSTLHLLDACQTTRDTRFVMASTIAVFGKGLTEPVANDAPRNPATIYGKTKLASEEVLEWYRRKGTISGVALRFPWVFGPGRETGITALYSSKLLDAVALGGSVDVPNPEESGDWLFVRDAVRAILLAIAADTNQLLEPAYNIMGGAHSIREVVQLAATMVPGVQLRWPASKDGGATGSASPYPATFDDSVARKDLHWAPMFTIEAAVREHIANVRSSAGL